MSDRCSLDPFPKGWYQVAYSGELEAGVAQPLEYFGRQLVMFRGEDGVARVLDAYCVHLGAHLGHGGTVEGNTIRCPFHGWCYDGEGACVDVPYARKIPMAAELRAWPVCERNGLIMVWHHPKDAAPDWDVPVVEEYGSEEWTPYETRRWKIRAHNQEMAENGVDKAHFHYVHGTLAVADTEATIDGPTLRVTSNMRMGTPKGEVLGQISSNAWGFGFSVVRFAGIVDTLLVTSVTPIDGEYVDVRFSFSVKKMGDASATKGVGAALIRDIEKQMAEDIPIWEHKVYKPKPMVCDGDGPIRMFRKWGEQFYVNGQTSERP